MNIIFFCLTEMIVMFTFGMVPHVYITEIMFWIVISLWGTVVTYFVQLVLSLYKDKHLEIIW